ncbi:MAG: hypothetical protein R3330_17275, partial [Saprospiraceae bacterium]|nr:hypothetical protein [Saprospiraceae bacterium]
FFSVDSLPIFLPEVPATSGNVVLTICENDNPDCCTVFEFASLQCAPECMIGPVSATVSDCDSAGLFFVTLDFDVASGDPGGFTVLGNGNNYGTFAYSEVPVTIGPFPGDSSTAYEFIVVDNGTPNCSNFAEVGVVNCETTGLFGPPIETTQLEVFGSGSRPWFRVPADAVEMTMWSLDGRPVQVLADISTRDVVFLRSDNGVPGLYLVHVTGAERTYVAKVFLAE